MSTETEKPERLYVLFPSLPLFPSPILLSPSRVHLPANSPPSTSSPVTVSKPIPLTFDLGELTAFDTNPLDPTSYTSSLETCLFTAARDGAQLLINQFLTTVPLKSTPDGVFAELPDPITPLPREKPLPKPKEPTKWFVFPALCPLLPLGGQL